MIYFGSLFTEKYTNSYNLSFSYDAFFDPGPFLNNISVFQSVMTKENDRAFKSLYAN